MATGKPPWSQQYQEVAALFHIGTTKSHPPIPEHLSMEAKDFLLRCLQKEPNLRSAASELLQHPFVTGEYREIHPVVRSSSVENSTSLLMPGSNLKNSIHHAVGPGTPHSDLKDVQGLDVRCSTVYPENYSESEQVWGTSTSDDMCKLDDKDFALRESVNSALMLDDPTKSFNPMCEPTDDWPCKFDQSPEAEQRGFDLDACQPVDGATASVGASVMKEEPDFTFPCGPSISEDEDELTETKIRAFLDEKALDLKKMQTPLYEEFYNTLNGASPLGVFGNITEDTATNYLKLPPKSKSPSKMGSKLPIDSVNTGSPGKSSRRESDINSTDNQSSREVPSQLPEWRGLIDSQKEPTSPSLSFSERQRKWKEELDQELERKREMMRQAGVGGKTLSPQDRVLNRPKDRSRFASPSK